MGRSSCSSKVGLRRGPWSTKEDTLLSNYIQEHGEGLWKSLPKKAGLLRCGKSCRLRWMNYLKPGIKRGNITQDEEDLIVRMHGLLGNRWSLIAGRIPGRTDNEIKNYWNTYLLKKLKSAGINLIPHKIIPKPPKLTESCKAAEAKGDDDDEEPMIRDRVSSRTNSYDSLAIGTSSSEGAAAGAEALEAVVAHVESPVFEKDGFVGGMGCALPVPHHQGSDGMLGDVSMWEKVYDEFLQLL